MSRLRSDDDFFQYAVKTTVENASDICQMDLLLNEIA